ncbi:MAG: hypothetical protein MUF87_22470 [Anaerolineae bacterium]|jgi:hypothetical protein|nr:hypothetical protein [Anaerolineae bacterium]
MKLLLSLFLLTITACSSAPISEMTLTPVNVGDGSSLGSAPQPTLSAEPQILMMQMSGIEDIQIPPGVVGYHQDEEGLYWVTVNRSDPGVRLDLVFGHDLPVGVYDVLECPDVIAPEFDGVCFFLVGGGVLSVERVIEGTFQLTEGMETLSGDLMLTLTTKSPDPQSSEILTVNITMMINQLTPTVESDSL